MLVDTEKLRQYGYRLDRFDRAYIGKLQQIIPSVNGWVLDIGCGEGSTTAEMTRNRKIVGLDIDRGSIKIAKLKHPNLDFVVADVLYIPFSSCFEMVVATQIIEHVSLPRLFFQEVVRVLVRGGYFALSTPNRYRISNIQRLFLDRVRGRASYPYNLGTQVHLREYTQAEIQHLLFSRFSFVLLFANIFGYYGNFCLPTSHPGFLCYMIFALGKKR